jgi:cytidylate kinase
MIQAGQSAMFQNVLKDMQDRDARDRSRSAAPLRPAEDAIIVDTSKMNAGDVLAFAKSRISAFT